MNGVNCGSDHLHFLFRYARGDYVHQETIMESEVANCDEDMQGEACQQKPLGVPLTRSSFIDAAYTNETILPKVHKLCLLGSPQCTNTYACRSGTVSSLEKAMVLSV